MNPDQMTRIFLVLSLACLVHTLSPLLSHLELLVVGKGAGDICLTPEAPQDGGNPECRSPVNTYTDICTHVMYGYCMVWLNVLVIGYLQYLRLQLF